MEEFKKALKDRRETVLSGLKHKMDNLRTENQFLRDLLQLHSIECPPLSEITGEQPQGSSTSEDVPSLDEEEQEVAQEKTPCEKCESLESDLATIKKELSRTQSDLQEANGQLVEQTEDLQKTRNHCQALKDVNRIIKELIGIRDQELTQVSISIESHS